MFQSEDGRFAYDVYDHFEVQAGKFESRLISRLLLHCKLTHGPRLEQKLLTVLP